MDSKEIISIIVTNVMSHISSARVKMKITTITLLILVGITGCAIHKTEETGSLTIHITSIGVQNIVPDMTVVRYNMYGNGPSGHSVEYRNINATLPSITINDLVIGSWNITVEGENVDNDVIVTGSTNVAVTGGSATEASIVVAPYSGNGWFIVNLTWPPGSIASPSIGASLISGSTMYPLDSDFTVSDGTAIYGPEEWTDGYYTLTLHLNDGATPVWGITAVVQIAANSTTNAIYNLTLNDFDTGSILLSINQAIPSPITINLEGTVQELVSGTDITVTALPSESVGSYQWYLNGNVLSEETSSSITMGDNLQEGVYNLNVVVTQADRLGSNGFSFEVVPLKIMVDHTVVDQYDQIPQVYIDEVKKMLLCVPGESHGTGYVYGLELLEAQDPTYSVNATWTGAPEAYTDQYLKVVRTYWTGSGWAQSGGEGEFYTNQAAVNMMKNYLTYMKDTENNPVSTFGFGWCWDMTWENFPGGGFDPVYGVRWAGSSEGGPDGNMRWGIDDEDTVLTGNSVNLYTYINAVVAYNEHEPDTITFFTTGPVDTYEGENGYQRYLKHEEIRKYVRENGGVLFDYADILCWSDVGEQNTTTWDTHTYQIGYSDNISGEYDGGHGSCHITEAGCLRLGKAMWWMLARIAGWDGQT